jgi:hypothetical protein
MKKAGASEKGRRKKDDPGQSKRFVETAKEVEASKTEKVFLKAVDITLVRKKLDKGDSSSG